MAFYYDIDIVSVCNLRCPSCPVGNSPDAERPTGMMSLELFVAILEKIRRETPKCKEIHLFNWTEPALHPELPKFIEIARAHKLRSTLSTNLNLFRRMDEVMAANPYSLRVSLSGFRQESYGRTHRRGKIEKVIENMRELRASVDRCQSKTKLSVLYHCYIDNMGEEYDAMAALCDELDFSFEPVWAYLMPLEKNLEYLGKGLSGEDAELVKLLAVKPDRAKTIALANPSKDCVLRANQTAINCDGSVALCCTVYDTKYTIAPNFLDTSHKTLQAAKYAHPMCHTCMSHGLHDVSVYSDPVAWNEAAQERTESGRTLPHTHVPRSADDGSNLFGRLRSLIFKS